MLKTHERTFSIMQKSMDFLMVALCTTIAFALRFHILPGGQQGLEMLFLKMALGLGLLTLYFFNKQGLYRTQRFNSRYREILAVFRANSFALLAFVILLYFFADERLSRLFILTYFVLSSLFLIATRMGVRNFLRSLRRKGKNLRHVLLIGAGPQALRYIQTVLQYKDAGIRIAGWVDADRELANQFKIKIFEEGLGEVKQKIKPDSLIVSYPSSQSHKIDIVIREHVNDLVPIQILPDLSYSFIGHQIEDFAGLPVFSLNTPNVNSWDYFIKRVLDFILTFIGLIIISPLFVIIAIGVKLSSPGPIFFIQERMGLDGRRFKMWKFRSMKVGDSFNHTQEWSNKDNPRKTAFGSLLRKTSMDELPQLFNVLMGHMSLVGPRPEQPFFVDKFRKEIPTYMLRHRMKAGITGWAQVNGFRGDTDLNQRIEFDLFYIKNWSLWLDFKILFLTFWKVLLDKSAY